MLYVIIVQLRRRCRPCGIASGGAVRVPAQSQSDSPVSSSPINPPRLLRPEEDSLFFCPGGRGGKSGTGAAISFSVTAGKDLVAG